MRADELPRDEPLRLFRVVKTCEACPTQFDALTAIEEQPRPVYIRYRHGRLLVAVGPPGGDSWSAVGSDDLWHESVDDTGQGYIEWFEIERRANVVNIGREVVYLNRW